MQGEKACFVASQISMRNMSAKERWKNDFMSRLHANLERKYFAKTNINPGISFADYMADVESKRRKVREENKDAIKKVEKKVRESKNQR